VPRCENRATMEKNKLIVPRWHGILSAFFTITSGQSHHNLTHWNWVNWKQQWSLQWSRRTSFYHWQKNKPIVPRWHEILSAFFTIKSGQSHHNLTHLNWVNWRRQWSLQWSRKTSFYHWKLFSSTLIEIICV
jgi:hypothetical protein